MLAFIVNANILYCFQPHDWILDVVHFRVKTHVSGMSNCLLLGFGDKQSVLFACHVAKVSLDRAPSRMMLCRIFMALLVQ